MSHLISIANATAVLLIVIAACSKSGRFVGIGALIVLAMALIIGVK